LSWLASLSRVVINWLWERARLSIMSLTPASPTKRSPAITGTASERRAESLKR
jgi:hypothetical protein